MTVFNFLFILAATLACCKRVEAANKQTCTGLMALKLAETGSTWFADLVQTTPAYHIEEEIYTRSDKHISVRHKETKLLSVLQCNHFGGKSPVHGFTINPKNNVEINWEKIVKMAQPHVVTWRRSNIVKTAVSIYRKGPERICGGRANIRHDDKCIHEKVTVSFPLLLEKLRTQSHYYGELDNATDHATRYANGLNMSMYYEAMQDDQEREMKKLATFLGDPSYSDKHLRNSSVIKKTSDDLRDVLTNFDDIAKSLADLHVPASLNCPLVAMFKETGFKVFEGCNYKDLGMYLDRFPTTKHIMNDH